MSLLHNSASVDSERPRGRYDAQRNKRKRRKLVDTCVEISRSVQRMDNTNGEIIVVVVPSDIVV